MIGDENAKTGFSHAIELRDVNFFYGDRHILKNITFRAPRAQTTVILGASGSGKTTLLKVIGGLLPPASGRVRVEGKDPMLNQGYRKMAMVFQGGALFDSLRVWENVALPLIAQREFRPPTDRRKNLSAHSIAEIRWEVERLLGLVELEGTEEMLIEQLSGGMQTRLAIARAFASQPEILLYDEPTSGLDPIVCVTICQLMKKLQFEQGVTSVLVTHHLSAALQVGDDFIVLRDGEVIFHGTARELLESTDFYIQQFLQSIMPPVASTHLVGANHHVSLGLRYAWTDTVDRDIGRNHA